MTWQTSSYPSVMSRATISPSSRIATQRSFPHSSSVSGPLSLLLPFRSFSSRFATTGRKSGVSLSAWVELAYSLQATISPEQMAGMLPAVINSRVICSRSLGRPFMASAMSPRNFLSANGRCMRLLVRWDFGARLSSKSSSVRADLRRPRAKDGTSVVLRQESLTVTSSGPRLGTAKSVAI